MIAQHLRIGNWVSLSGSRILKVYEINKDCFYAQDEDESSFKSSWADLHPVPLSEEILLKCGCEISPLSIGIKYKYLYRLVWDDEFKYWDILLGEYGNFLTRIRYLHEWQNFIHIMHGEELEINL